MVNCLLFALLVIFVRPSGKIDRVRVRLMGVRRLVRAINETCSVRQNSCPDSLHCELERCLCSSSGFVSGHMIFRFWVTSMCNLPPFSNEISILDRMANNVSNARSTTRQQVAQRSRVAVRSHDR